jgi:hypothetical protein
VTFAAQSTDSGAPAVKARIYVGHYEARVSPIADTDPATNAPSTATTNNLNEKAAFAPGTYEFIATAPGYGAVRFCKTFKAVSNHAIALKFAPNVASSTEDATPSGDVAPFTSTTGAVIQDGPTVLKNLIDDTEASDWQAAATQGANGERNVDGKRVTIDLAGARPQTIRHVQVSAMLGPVFDGNRSDVSQNRFTALRQFEIWTCDDQAADCSNDDSYQRAYASASMCENDVANVPRLVART